ncbi:MAG: hypothetical protein KKF56_03330 [Nanoarchaeota archaeon]|nr:hypothetical protein [Nanoarchaeota archaeon]
MDNQDRDDDLGCGFVDERETLDALAWIDFKRRAKKVIYVGAVAAGVLAIGYGCSQLPEGSFDRMMENISRMF